MSNNIVNWVPRTILGRTGLEVSKLSLGTWGFGNASAPEARIGDDDNLVAVLQATFDAGINFFDSAEAYANEERLGQLLKQVDMPDDLVVATKFGHGKGFSAEQFKRSIEQSLRDLGIEKIELMMIHDPRRRGGHGDDPRQGRRTRGAACAAGSGAHRQHSAWRRGRSRRSSSRSSAASST